MSPLHVLIERPGTTGIARTFDADAITVGRSEKADITVDDHSVSRRHARLFREGGEWFVEDLGSRNGTELNRERLSAPSAVRVGDTIAVGATILRIVADGEKHDGAPGSAGEPAADTADDSAVFSVLRPARDLMPLETAESTGTAASSRLRLLNEVHRALAGPITRDDLLRMILDRAFAALAPEQAAIFLRGRNGELYRAAQRESRSASGPLLVSTRLAEEVTVKGSAALVLDAQVDERFAGARSIMSSGVRSILAAPLADPEGCLGMIALYSSMRARRFTEQDLELLVSLASAAALRIRNIELAEAAAERRVVDREIALASDIQMAMLRRRPPERPEVDLAAQLVAARSVGGDFYDFLIDGDRLWFIVADVSGKGIGAALMTAVAQTLFRAQAASGLALPEVMKRMNRELARDNDRAMFVTALAGCLDLASGTLDLANAGHNPPYRLRADGAIDVPSVKNAIALGVVEEADFPVTQVTLEANDALLVYTDGVSDARDSAHRSFGIAGLEAYLRTAANRPVHDIVTGLCESIAAFAGGAPQEDDITVAAVRYRGRSEA